MKIQPIILGRGRAGQAIAESLQLLSAQSDLEWEIQTPRWLSRDYSDTSESFGPAAVPVIFLANPPGRHAESLLKARRAGFRFAVIEKPSAVSLEEIGQLQNQLDTEVAVLHVYRQTWGPQELRRRILAGNFGYLIGIEGRYWQSSTARADPSKPTWKNDPLLSGPHDTLLDIGSHWADLMTFLVGSSPTHVEIYRNYSLAPAPHRDTHVHMTLDMKDGNSDGNSDDNSKVRTFGSISKVVHGAGNILEIHILGTKGSAEWNLGRPDEIQIGNGFSKTTIVRETQTHGSRHAAFHGVGWLEGYIEIIKNYFRYIESLDGEPAPKPQTPLENSFPTLTENLKLLENILVAAARDKK